MCRSWKKPVTFGGHGQPPLALGGELLEGQPVPVADLDGIGTAAGGQQAQHVALEEGRVHAELQGSRRPNAVRRPSITSRRNAPLCLESCTLPGRFFTRRMWPVWATWASSG
mgnify:CR=1 FL=1